MSFIPPLKWFRHSEIDREKFYVVSICFYCNLIKYNKILILVYFHQYSSDVFCLKQTLLVNFKQWWLLKYCILNFAVWNHPKFMIRKNEIKNSKDFGITKKNHNVSVLMYTSLTINNLIYWFVCSNFRIIPLSRTEDRFSVQKENRYKMM